ncbi:MAG: hypothetical protein AAFW73_16330 [Bacteroidota bacterium]
MMITDSSLPRDLQHSFQLQFPHLKIEFYQGQHAAPAPAGSKPLRPTTGS